MPKPKPVVNDIKQGPLANCIVLHDLAKKKPDLRGWFEYTVKFFEKHGIVPTKVSNLGANPSLKRRSNITFKNASRRLYESNFEGIDGIWMGATPHNHYRTDSSGSIFSTWLDLDDRREVLLLCFDDQIVSFNKELINQLTTDLADFFRPHYGYCYQREFSKGPEWYPFGVCSGTEDDDPEEKLITKWANTYHVSDGIYKTGDMRDIYPMNILSVAHSKHIVESQPLFDWIKTNPERGELIRLIKEDLWAWWIDPSQISTVRETLRPLGWMIAI